ncbi:hypothetical protein E1B28_011310 [Marasmius oreades]|uniref:HMG box domain-containing protein n=1 Tax=Marasmius oreades TaxID=181124 RepID=A0A9P7RUF3_9AGAR|nr:uncharacterized protein E1B28_011310 [Marasmius oreades]KAG7089648.1 hypothetical protein E1B28_011310 [Marasmius oreades]
MTTDVGVCSGVALLFSSITVIIPLDDLIFFAPLIVFQMPASRTRRRSSILNPPQPTKPGVYGVPSIPHRLTFCPNVTPVSYTSSLESDDAGLGALDAAETLFPPSEAPSQPSRRRQPPGKRRSQGYIPRPPNAFMLFRADFVRQKHVPGNIEANHGSLSRIIGNCWRSLPAQDKRIWEFRAKRAKELHKQEFPNYKFKPVHNKKKKGNQSESTSPTTSYSSSTSKVKLTISTSGTKKSKSASEEEDAAVQARNEYLTQLLLDGLRNELLADEMAKYDERERVRREAALTQSPHSEEEDPSEDEESSETTTLLGEGESYAAWGIELNVPTPSHSSTSSSSPTPPTAWTNPNPFSYQSSVPHSIQQPQTLYPAHHQQLGSYLHLRRSSSVPPMMGMMDNTDEFYQSAPFGVDGYQNVNDSNTGEMRPPSPGPPGMPAAPISSLANAFGPPQQRQSFSQPRFSFSQLRQSFSQPRFSFSQMDAFAQMDTTGVDPFTQHGYYGQRMSISAEHRMLLGGRRASSADGMRRSWGTCNSINQGWGWGVQGAYWVPQTTSTGPLQTDDSPLPEVDTSLFEPGFNLNSFTMSSSTAPAEHPPSPDGTGPQVVSPLDPIQPAPVPVAAPQPTYRAPIPERRFLDMTQQAFVEAYPSLGPVENVAFKVPNIRTDYGQGSTVMAQGEVATFQHAAEQGCYPTGPNAVATASNEANQSTFEAAAMRQHRVMTASC